MEQLRLLILGTNRHILMGIASAAMTEWISVKDKLPSLDEDVMVCARGSGGIGNTYLKDDLYAAIDALTSWKDGTEPSFRTERFGYGIVTHWAEIPKFIKE